MKNKPINIENYIQLFHEIAELLEHSDKKIIYEDTLLENVYVNQDSEFSSVDIISSTGTTIAYIDFNTNKIVVKDSGEKELTVGELDKLLRKMKSYTLSTDLKSILERH